jgi:hypothetical protein
MNEQQFPATTAGTKFCFACGQVIDSRAEICPNCGVRQPDALAAQLAVPPAARNILSGLAIVSGVIALIFFPIVFGPLGIVLAAIGLVRKERLWPVGLAVAIVGMLVGMAFGAWVALQYM